MTPALATRKGPSNTASPDQPRRQQARIRADQITGGRRLPTPNRSRIAGPVTPPLDDRQPDIARPPPRGRRRTPRGAPSIRTRGGNRAVPAGDPRSPPRTTRNSEDSPANPTRSTPAPRA